MSSYDSETALYGLHATFHPLQDVPGYKFKFEK